METKCGVVLGLFVLLLWAQYVVFHAYLGASPPAIRMVKYESRRDVYYPRLTNEEQQELELKLKEASTKTKYILHWYGKKPNNSKWRSEICGKCEFTNDRNMIHHPDTGAVVFFYNKIDSDSLPEGPRRTDQLHVWYSGEAPSSVYCMRHFYFAVEDRYQFNLTQNYRRDSGIYHPYVKMQRVLELRLKDSSRRNTSQLLKKKTKVAAAVVSNCNATTGAKARVKLIEKMIELGLEIDTFGRCFGNKINVTHRELEELLKKYKFYLAFENSYHCRDYITEKFSMNGFKSGTVPVVLGATKEDYLAIAPKGSFIFAEDFSSVASLVNYLNYLNRNDEEYLEYFSWIKRGQSALPMRGRIGGFCQLCRVIHGINVDDVYYPQYNSTKNRRLFTDYIVERRVTGLRDWYYNTENKHCFERKPERLVRFMKFHDFSLPRNYSVQVD